MNASLLVLAGWFSIPFCMAGVAGMIDRRARVNHLARRDSDELSARYLLEHRPEPQNRASERRTALR